jgi:predicted transcriptional regulator
LRVLNVVLRRVGVVALTTLGILASASCKVTSAVVEAEATARVDPVPPPDGLLAEVSVRGPDAAWGRVQRGVGGAVALLPATVGDLACAYAGLEAALAQFVDGKGTSYVVLGDGGYEQGDSAAGVPAAHWVSALPITDLARASALLLDGEDAARGAAVHAPYTVHDVAGMKVLSAHEVPLAVTVALAVGARSWLVLASSEADLARLGPYAIRTMPTKAGPAGSAAIVADVPQSALAGPFARWLRTRWAEGRAWLDAKDQEQRAQHDGRAPDFGDPQPLVRALDDAVERRVALLAQAQSARVTVDTGEDDVHAEVTIEPGSDTASRSEVASMAPGDARPLASAPGDAILAMMVRDDPKERDAEAAALQMTIDRVLADRLHEDDSRAVHAAIADWMHARGDWWTAAVAWGASDASRGLWLTTPAASAGASSSAIHELVELSQRRVLRDLLASSFHLLPAAVTRVDAPPLRNVSLATFPERRAGSIPASSAGLGVAWGVLQDRVPGELLLAAGPAARELLSTQAAGPGRLGDDPRSARAFAALGDRVTFALYAQPLRLDAARGGPSATGSAPVVVAWGRDGSEVWARVEVADALLQALVRLRGDL